MPVAPSALSIATERVRLHLNDQFRRNNASVNVLVGTPVDALKAVNAANGDRSFVNLYPYRIKVRENPSRLPGESTPVSLFLLISGFGPKDAIGTISRGDMDLRIMGEVIRILEEFQQLPPAPGDTPTRFLLDLIPQDASTEDVNNIWTMLSANEPYRLSMIYELAVIIIDPVQPLVDAPPVRQGEFDADVIRVPT